MNKLLITTFSILMSVSTVTWADNIYMTIVNPTNSPEAIPQKLLSMTGPIDHETVEPSLYSNTDQTAMVIDTDIAIGNLDAINHRYFTNVDSVILTGKPENNLALSTHILGYGSKSEYLVIKGVKTPESIKLVQFNDTEKHTTSDIAKSLLKSAIN